jgi:hypothetical protein
MSIIVEFCRCGFGFSGGALPIVRLGVARIAWLGGSLLEELEQNRRALAKAATALELHRAERVR